MFGCGGASPRAGCSNTSVFCRLMVRPMALTAVDRQMTNCCRSGSFRAARAKSSAKRSHAQGICLGLQTSQIKESAITSVADGDASICGGECRKHHGSEHEGEKSWSQFTTLFDAIGD